jgi:hypothetical protein
LIPPPISQSEAKHGLLSLLQRGLIPPSAKITFDPEPIITQTLNLNEKDDTEAMKKIEYPASDLNENIYKLDRNYELQLQMKMKMKKKIHNSIDTNETTSMNEKQKYAKKKSTHSSQKLNPSLKTELSIQNNENPLVNFSNVNLLK